MAITLRQESDARATTKGSSLTFQELDTNFIELLDRVDPANSIVAGDNITITQPDSTGAVTISAAVLDTQIVGGTDITVSQPDSAGAFTVSYSGTAGIADILEDTTPQLGGNLDLNSNDIDGTGNIDITGNVVAQSAINAQTGTTYTLVLSDASKLVTLSNASAITLTIPTNASVAYPVGTKIDLAQIGAGQVTVAGAGGVTVNATPGLKFVAQYSAATCIKTATDTWLLVGNLEA